MAAWMLLLFVASTLVLARALRVIRNGLDARGVVTKGSLLIVLGLSIMIRWFRTGEEEAEDEEDDDRVEEFKWWWLLLVVFVVACAWMAFAAAVVCPRPRRGISCCCCC